VLVVPLRALVPTGRTTSTESPSAARGYAEVWHNPTTRLLLGLLGAEYVVIGALDLLFVIMAIDLLHASQAWAGYLNMAYGFGGVVFGAFAVLLIGRRLGPVVTVTATLLGAGLATTVLTSSPAVAAVLLTVVGGCRALFDLGTRTLLQRAVPADTVGLTFGVAESLSMAGLAVGSLLVPALVALDGARLALVGVSIVLPVIVLARLRILLRVDQQARVPLVEISLLRSLPLFQALPMPSLEGLARDLRRVEFGPGEVIVRQGDVGDRYYAIVDGVVDITQHGGRIATLTRGDGLGEIALLRDSPRTATALASTRVTTYTLEREAFLSAINAHAPTRELASRTDRDVAARDARRQPPAS
jgi:hypothetical protein